MTGSKTLETHFNVKINLILSFSLLGFKITEDREMSPICKGFIHDNEQLVYTMVMRMHLVPQASH